jgi:SAM-dependent methyltransferase
MANEAMATNWAAGASGWVENERIFDSVFAPVTRMIVEASDFGAARRVLDVGCGAGTLLEAAAAAGAAAVGVDISPGMTAAAQRRVPAATVVTADAQSTDLLAAAPGESFDRVVSRFGVMFFADPAAAFANIRAACTADARMVFACWREDAREIATLGTEVIRAAMADPVEPPAVGEPGPFGLADPDHLRQVLDDAGWTDIQLHPHDPVLDYSIDGSDGVDERLAVALSGMVGRAARAELEPELGPDGWAALVDAARADLRGRITDGSVRTTGCIWLVTARNHAGG